MNPQGTEEESYGEPDPPTEVPYDFDAEPVPTQGSASLDSKWWEADPPCPAGSELQGGVPPEHLQVGCKTARGKNVGPTTKFYPGGKKREEGQFEDHFAVGIWTAWDEEGNRLSETPYSAGKKEGLETIWYPSGEIKSQRPYQGGLRHGLVTIWDEQGRKRTMLTYVHGKQNGPEARYGIDGQLARVIEWKAGVVQAEKK